MKILAIIFCVLFIWCFIFAKIDVNGSKDITIVQRVFASMIISVILTLIFGLPVLGILYLLGVGLR